MTNGFKRGSEYRWYHVYDTTSCFRWMSLKVPLPYNYSALSMVPATILLFYLVTPINSTLSFWLLFGCHGVADEWGVVCSDLQTERMRRIAWGGVVAYAVLVPLAIGSFLLANGKGIRRGSLSRSSKAAILLHDGYQRSNWLARNWEILEFGRKLLLTSVLYTIDSEYIQRAAAFFGTIFWLGLVTYVRPFSVTGNNTFSISLAAILIVNCFICYLLETRGAIKEDAVKNSLDFLLGLLLFIELLIVVVWLFLTARGSIYAQRALRPLTWNDSKMEVSPHSSFGLPGVGRSTDKYRFHIFLSHCETGRYQARALKLQLEDMLPGLSCCLAEEKKSAEKTLEDIERSRVFLVYLSAGYFQSPSAMADLKTAATSGSLRRLLVAVETADGRGSLTLRDALEQCPSMYSRFFKRVFECPDPESFSSPCPVPCKMGSRSPLQQVSLRILAQQVLLASRPHDAATRYDFPFLPRSFEETEIVPKLPAPNDRWTHHVYASLANPGARELLVRLAERRGCATRRENLELVRDDFGALVRRKKPELVFGGMSSASLSAGAIGTAGGAGVVGASGAGGAGVEVATGAANGGAAEGPKDGEAAMAAAVNEDDVSPECTEWSCASSSSRSRRPLRQGCLLATDNPEEKAKYFLLYLRRDTFGKVLERSRLIAEVAEALIQRQTPGSAKLKRLLVVYECDPAYAVISEDLANVSRLPGTPMQMPTDALPHRGGSRSGIGGMKFSELARQLPADLVALGLTSINFLPVYSSVLHPHHHVTLKILAQALFSEPQSEQFHGPWRSVREGGGRGDTFRAHASARLGRSNRVSSNTVQADRPLRDRMFDLVLQQPDLLAGATPNADSRFIGSVVEMNFGQLADTAYGLESYIHVASRDELLRKMANGLDEVKAEFRRCFRRGSKELEVLDYVFSKPAGSCQLTFQDGLKLDCGPNGELLPSRKTAAGTPMRIEDFLQHHVARRAMLELKHVAALRLYTTLLYKSINDPLRNREPHKLPVTIKLIDEAVKRLSQAQAASVQRRRDGGSKVLFRGLRDRSLPSGFLDQGGTEVAPLSTTSKLEVAMRYASRACTSAHCVLFQLRTSKLQLGADISFLSAFPAEQEILFPPLTYLEPKGESQVIVINEFTFTVVDVQVHVGSV